MEVTCWGPSFWLQNEEDCLKQLEKQWDTVPLLNVNDIQNLHNQKLIRFRGMVQDMYNPEFYFKKYEVHNEVTKDSHLKNGKYMDIADCKDDEVVDYDSPRNVSGDRETLVVISIPALNAWVENIEKENYRIVPPQTKMETSPSKRKLEDEEESMETDGQASSSNNKDNESNKKLRTTQAEGENLRTNQNTVSIEHLLNFPIPVEGRNAKACHVKIYKSTHGLKLNDMCEFVGFLSVDPLLAVNTNTVEDDALENEMEVQTHNPSPSLIPRIHCVSWRKLKHNNPLMEKDSNMSMEKIGDIRKELLIVLTQLLLGDELAAEYLMYHMISGVYLRQEMLAIGKFSLNLSQIPVERIPEYNSKLYSFIENFLPKSHYLPMTLDNMNTLTFTPKKDYDCNRLTSGLLQLSAGTHLVLDETKLSAGKLNEAGVKAVSSISKIIQHQKIMYDFVYYQMEYDSNIPFLILSEGKSFLPSDFHIPLKPAEICIESFDELVESMKAYLIPERLNDIRRYLTHTREGKYEICDDVEKMVQDEFVKLRQEENATVEDLHNLLALARFICLSEGKEKLNDVCLNRACQLESARRTRIKSLQK